MAGYTGDQIANAAAIVAVGKQLAVPQQGWVVALAAARRESGLRNLPAGEEGGRIVRQAGRDGGRDVHRVRAARPNRPLSAHGEAGREIALIRPRWSVDGHLR